MRVNWKGCRGIQYLGRGVQQLLPAVLLQKRCQYLSVDKWQEKNSTGLLAVQSMKENYKPTQDHHSPLGTHHSQLQLCNVSICRCWIQRKQEICSSTSLHTSKKKSQSGNGWTWILKSNIPSFISLKHRWLKIQYSKKTNDSIGCEANLGEKKRRGLWRILQHRGIRFKIYKFIHLKVYRGSVASGSTWERERERERKRKRGRTNKLFSHLLSQSCL